ncbi:MAG: preprotein translocase subunit YajC [Acidobacteria bacterium]|nr:preprotein translocase subunit YajC [Acidobacteriota bacterium]
MIESWFVNPPVLAADPGAGGTFVQFLPFILIFAIFYFLLILPQQRQRRKTQEMLANLKTGDRVVTGGGIYGTIVGFRSPSVLQLEVAHQVRIDVARSAVSGLQSAEGEGEGSGAREAAAKGKK